MKLKNLKAIELFAGIGGFRLAAEDQQVTTVWANDIDPKACAIYRNRFGDKELIQGDIHHLSKTVPAHDLLTGGFPCQPFSSAGKKKGIRDPRGTLFEEIVKIIKQHNPSCFVLENVKRLLTMEQGAHFATILSALAEIDYQIEWRLLNAMHFGLPQNRQRIIILGIRKDLTNSDSFDHAQIRLAPSADFLNAMGGETRMLYDEEKWCLITEHGQSFANWGVANKSKYWDVELSRFTEGSHTPLLREVLEQNTPAEFDFTDSTLRRLPSNAEVNRYVGGVQIISNQGGGARMGYTVFGIDGIAPTLTAASSRHYERYKINGKYRRLTNIEYARIQGFPDDHCREVSVYNQYGLYGNAVPPPLVKWVFERLAVGGAAPPLFECPQMMFAGL